MNDLVRWLGEQLDEDAARATAAGGDAWRRQEHPSETVAIYDSKGEPVVYDEGSPTEEQQAHIVRHDPARVLREIDAKRQLLDEHPSVNGSDLGSDCGTCYRGDGVNARWPCRTLRLLAMPYADRAGYQESWRP